MQTVLNADFHLDGGIQLGVRAECVNHDIQFFAEVVESSAYSGPKEIPGAEREGAKEKVTKLLNQYVTSV